MAPQHRVQSLFKADSSATDHGHAVRWAMNVRLFSVWMGLCACKTDPPAPVSPAVGDGLFSEGCPDGGVLARQIGVADTLPGKVAVGTQGDYLLANEHAAFVITEPDKGSTYYYYGGIVADAVAMDGCTVIGDDRLDEVALVLGRFDLTDISQSILRGFRGTSVEIIADGQDGGPATVRVHGVDDTHWLVEYELVLQGMNGGGRPLSTPLGVDLAVDYTLYPDSPVLWIDLQIENTSDEEVSLFSASLLSFGETMDVHSYASGALSISGLSLGHSIPWMLATDGEASLAYAVLEGNLAYLSISGVQVALDLIRATSDPFALTPGQVDHATTLLSVGYADGPTATVPLADVNPQPIPEQSYTLDTVSGTVVDPSGAPIPNATISIEASTSSTDWGVVDEARSDEQGQFSVPIPVFDTPWSWRLVAQQDGRDDSDAVTVTPGDDGVVLSMSGLGQLSYTLTDETGAPSPARLHLLRDDGVVEERWLVDSGTTPVPPGNYTFTATRGFEYAPVTGSVVIEAGMPEELSMTLEHLVDSSGFFSIDTHVHTSHSPDSRTGQIQSMQVAAAHGLHVVVNTEHEVIVDQSAAPIDAGVADWSINITGEEVTATVPEHMTMFPAQPDGSVRGGIVEWYGMDIADLFAAMRERSDGGVNLLNHPSYMDIIDWDRDLAEPMLDDPTLLGLAPDAALWSWDFDGVEVFNGHRSPFDDGNGRFDNWMSMLNAGHPISAIGCSDDHGGTGIGFPRTYFAADAETVSTLDADDIVDAFHQGQLLASTGAFARVSVDGAGLGSVVTDTDGVVDLSVHIEAIPEIDVTHVVVLANCQELLSIPASDPTGIIKHSEVLSLNVDEDAHVVVLAMGTQRLPAGLPQFDATHVPRVTTNPIYIDADGDGMWTPPGGQSCAYDLSFPD